MTKARHTPGPWQQDLHYIVAPDPSGIHPDIYIAEIAEEDSEGRIAPPEQQLANGNLITAAPDLLAACRMVAKRWERGDLAEAARACHAAVILATGDCGSDDAATSEEVTPYSVLLLFPDYLNDSGTSTYYMFVNAPDPLAAVMAAQAEAAAGPGRGPDDAEDFAPLLVLQGHHASEPLFNL